MQRRKRNDATNGGMHDATAADDGILLCQEIDPQNSAKATTTNPKMTLSMGNRSRSSSPTSTKIHRRRRRQSSYNPFYYFFGRSTNVGASTNAATPQQRKQQSSFQNRYSTSGNSNSSTSVLMNRYCSFRSLKVIVSVVSFTLMYALLRCFIHLIVDNTISIDSNRKVKVTLQEYELVYPSTSLFLNANQQKKRSFAEPTDVFPPEPYIVTVTFYDDEVNNGEEQTHSFQHTETYDEYDYNNLDISFFMYTNKYTYRRSILQHEYMLYDKDTLDQYDPILQHKYTEEELEEMLLYENGYEITDLYYAMDDDYTRSPYRIFINNSVYYVEDDENTTDAYKEKYEPYNSKPSQCRRTEYHATQKIINCNSLHEYDASTQFSIGSTKFLGYDQS